MPDSARIFLWIVLLPFCRPGWGQERTLPPLIDSREVHALIQQLGADSYQQRTEAQTALIKLGKGLLPLLDEFALPESVEIRYRLARIRSELSTGRFIHYYWQLGCKPLDGETLNLSATKTVQFYSDGTFRLVGGRNQRKHSWEISDDGKGLQLVFNEGYATYRGNLTGPDRGAGRAENIKGKQWTFEIIRKQRVTGK